VSGWGRNSRGGRSDWDTRSTKNRERYLATLGALAGKPCPECQLRPDEQCSLPSCPYREQAPRAKAVQREAGDAAHVANVAAGRWWGDLLQRHDSAHNFREGGQQRQEGHQKGWPDFTLHAPPSSGGLELKAENRRPAQPPGQWWVTAQFTRVLVPRTGELEWRLMDAAGYDRASRHGVDAAQARWLQVQHRCGWRTAVCYGAVEALAQLDAWAGARS